MQASIAEGVLNSRGSAYATTDHLGNFTLTVDPGNYIIYADPAGMQNIFHSSTFNYNDANYIGVGAGEAVTGKNITTPAFSYGEIGGIVIDQYDNPVVGAGVTCRGGITYPDTTTDSGGHFSFTQLIPYDDFVLYASKNGYIDGSDNNLELGSGAIISPITIEMNLYPTTSIEG